MAVSPYPIDPDLTAIAVAYKNPGYIADIVVPRIRVAKQRFSFLQYPLGMFYNVQDMLVGRRSKPDEMTFEGVEVIDQTADYGGDSKIPLADIENSDTRYDPKKNAVMALMEAVKLARELRASALLHTAANYDALLQVTLSGTGQYSDKVNSDPVTSILNYLELPLLRPTDMTLNTECWNQLRTHPKMVQAIYGSAATAGVVSAEQVAQLFDLERVNVGRSRRNLNRPGQAFAAGRFWGKHIALTYNSPVASAETPTFAATFQWGDAIAGEMADSDVGLRGGVVVRAGESVKERIVASQAGFFIQNAVA